MPPGPGLLNFNFSRLNPFSDRVLVAFNFNFNFSFLTNSCRVFLTFPKLPKFPKLLTFLKLLELLKPSKPPKSAVGLRGPSSRARGSRAR